MKIKTVHELLLEYRSGAIDKASIMERIARLMYEQPWRFGFDDVEASAEALLRYRHRIEGLIDRYEDRGSSFDRYLSTSLRFLAKTRRRDYRRRIEPELVCERSCLRYEAEQDKERYSPTLIDSSEPESTELSPLLAQKERRLEEFHSEAQRSRLRVSFAARLVFLAVKCAWEIEEPMLEKIARYCKVETSWLAVAVLQGRRFLEHERRRFERLEARQYKTWLRIRLYESRLSRETAAAKRQKLVIGLHREKRRLGKIKTSIGKYRPLVPNSAIALILGVPKGTVDSGLYYLKKQLGSASVKQGLW